ncbi:MAG: alpha/beta hydrolase [Thiotrichaceae bacterium]
MMSYTELMNYLNLFASKQLLSTSTSLMVKRVISSFLLILLTGYLSSCSQVGSVLLNSTAKTGDYIKTGDVSYGTHQRNKLDVYRPKKTNSNKSPVVVFFYGGCWGECSSLKKKDYLFVAQSLSSRGYVTVIPNFREYPEVTFQPIMADAASVMRWVSQHIDEYAGDANKVVIAGHSSGAHIGATLALDKRYLDSGLRSRIRGFIGFAGPYDFLPLDEAYQRKLFGPPKHYAASQPINFVSSQSPAMLLLHGKKDTTVKPQNSHKLAVKAQSLGVDSKVIEYPKHDHVGILIALSRPLQRKSSVLVDVIKFLEQHAK